MSLSSICLACVGERLTVEDFTGEEVRRRLARPMRRDQFAIDVVLASIQFSQWGQKESNLRCNPNGHPRVG